MFTADWCPPCQKFKKTEVQKLKDFGLKVGIESDCEFKIVNIDEYPELYQKYGKNRSIPCFVFFEEEKEKKSIQGFTSAETIFNLWKTK